MGIEFDDTKTRKDKDIEGTSLSTDINSEGDDNNDSKDNIDPIDLLDLSGKPREIADEYKEEIGKKTEETDQLDRELNNLEPYRDNNLPDTVEYQQIPDPPPYPWDVPYSDNHPRSWDYHTSDTQEKLSDQKKPSDIAEGKDPSSGLESGDDNNEILEDQEKAKLIDDTDT